MKFEFILLDKFKKDENWLSMMSFMNVFHYIILNHDFFFNSYFATR